MSRCFPFPPPGYEKKVRSEDVNLLRKEKHTAKQHKKEKREGKEKREKDKGDGQLREKKDRKDKDWDKNKNREKEKKEKDKDKKSISSEKRVAGKFEGYNREKLSQNGHLAEVAKDSKFVVDTDRRIHHDNKRTGNQLVGKFCGTGRKNGGIVRLVAKDIGTWAEGMDKFDENRVGHKQLDRLGFNYEARPSLKNAVVPNLLRTVWNRLEEVPRPMENIENIFGGKEKAKKSEGGGKKGDAQKEKDREKKSQGKDKDKDKEKSRGNYKGRDEKLKDGKVKQIGENRNIENGKLRKSNKDDLSFNRDIYPFHLPKDNDSSAAEENIRTQKEIEGNGCSHDNDVRPNKLQRTTSFHPLMEKNGAKLAHCHTPTLSASNNDEGPSRSLKVDNKGQRINGIVEAPQLSSIPLTKPPSLEITQSGKPPHPDSKYLSWVLSVPKVEEWCCIDDQEWLFSSNSLQLKKPGMGLSKANAMPQPVWAEALRIESADVCALPFVIPY